jgi:hypothetical protein
MATRPTHPREKIRAKPSNEGAKQFWQRVTEGIELNQLWSQFRKDAHSSYRLYAHHAISRTTRCASSLSPNELLNIAVTVPPKRTIQAFISFIVIVCLDLLSGM